MEWRASRPEAEQWAGVSRAGSWRGGRGLWQPWEPGLGRRRGAGSACSRVYLCLGTFHLAREEQMA